MVLTGETNIREVIPFPKNGSGVDPMTGSPSSVSQKQLTELNLKITD
jgi:aspartyl-tRNA synthetase